MGYGVSVRGSKPEKVSLDWHITALFRGNIAALPAYNLGTHPSLLYTKRAANCASAALKPAMLYDMDFSEGKNVQKEKRLNEQNACRGA